jgi:uncharacterized protein
MRLRRLRNDKGKVKLDTLTYVILLAGALCGGFVSGLAGFGTALMALGIWLYALPPALAVPLVMISSVVAQSATLPSMWRSFDFSLIWPFIIGGLAGVPIGTLLVAHADPQTFKFGFGLLLMVFPAVLYLQRAPMALRVGGKPADTAIGFAGGILGGLSGLSGPIPILWASVRGWNKDERRGIFQVFNWTILITALCLQIGAGMVKTDVIWLALVTLPATLVGAWLGTRVYHALNDRNFRDVVLGLVLFSGVTLVWSSFGH